MITSTEREKTRPGEIKNNWRTAKEQVSTRKRIIWAMIVSREIRVQTAERKIRNYRKQHSCVRGSDRITPRSVTDMEITNEKEGLLAIGTSRAKYREQTVKTWRDEYVLPQLACSKVRRGTSNPGIEPHPCRESWIQLWLKRSTPVTKTSAKMCTNDLSVLFRRSIKCTVFHFSPNYYDKERTSGLNM